MNATPSPPAWQGRSCHGTRHTTQGRTAGMSFLRAQRTTLSVHLLSAAFMIGILVFWQIGVRFRLASTLILPPPLEVWDAFVGGVIVGHWWLDIYFTVKATVLGA